LVTHKFIFKFKQWLTSFEHYQSLANGSYPNFYLMLVQNSGSSLNRKIGHAWPERDSAVMPLG